MFALRRSIAPSVRTAHFEGARLIVSFPEHRSPYKTKPQLWRVTDAVGEINGIALSHHIMM
jgi:hypothetical protein